MTKSKIKFGDTVILTSEINTLNKIRKTVSDGAKSLRVSYAKLLHKYKIKSGTKRAGEFSRDFIAYMNLDKNTFISVNKVARHLVNEIKDPNKFDDVTWEDMKKITDLKDPKKVSNGKKGGKKSKPPKTIKKTPTEIILDLYVAIGTKNTENAIKEAKAKFMAIEQKNQLVA